MERVRDIQDGIVIKGDVQITLENADLYVTLGRTDKGVYVSLDDGYGNDVFYDLDEALVVITYALYLIMKEARGNKT